MFAVIFQKILYQVKQLISSLTEKCFFNQKKMWITLSITLSNLISSFIFIKNTFSPFLMY